MPLTTPNSSSTAAPQGEHHPRRLAAHLGRRQPDDLVALDRAVVDRLDEVADPHPRPSRPATRLDVHDHPLGDSATSPKPSPCPAASVRASSGVSRKLWRSPSSESTQRMAS